MNKRIEKVLLLVGAERHEEFYREANFLLEAAETNPSQFTGAELVLIQVFLKQVLKSVAKHSKGMVPDFDDEDLAA